MRRDTKEKEEEENGYSVIKCSTIKHCPIIFKIADRAKRTKYNIIL